MKPIFFIGLFIGAMLCPGQAISQKITGVSSDAAKLGNFSVGNNEQAIAAYTAIRNKIGYDERNKEISLKDIQGSIYLTEHFMPGMVYYDGKNAGYHYLRYNGYSDEVEIKENQYGEGEIKALLKTTLISCSIDEKPLYYMPYTNPAGERVEGYFFELYKGAKYELYAKKVKLLKEGKPARTPMQASFPPRWADEVAYYYRKASDNGSLMYLGGKKKELLAHFPEEKKSLETYLKKQDVNMEKEQDLVQLFIYLNTLL